MMGLVRHCNGETRSQRLGPLPKTCEDSVIYFAEGAGNTRPRAHAGFNEVLGPSSGMELDFLWCLAEGGRQPSVVWLQHARRTPIRRYIKVRGEANPYDPLWKAYFALRRSFRSGREVYFTDPAMPDPPHISNRLRVSARGVPKA